MCVHLIKMMWIDIIVFKPPSCKRDTGSDLPWRRLSRHRLRPTYHPSAPREAWKPHSRARHSQAQAPPRDPFCIDKPYPFNIETLTTTHNDALRTGYLKVPCLEPNNINNP